MSATSTRAGRDIDHASESHRRAEAPVTRRLSTETKASFKTTEFFAMIAVIVGILIAAASIKGTGTHVDIFTASRAWLYVAIVASAYMISRGLAKSGSSQPYDEQDDRRS